MVKKKNKQRLEIEVLESIENKIGLLVLITSLNGKSEEDQIKILKSYSGPLSKRELEKITGIGRSKF